VFPALQLAHLSDIVNGQESNDHAKILVEVAWVLSFLTEGAGEAVPAVVDVDLLNALASHVHQESSLLTVMPNTTEIGELNHAHVCERAAGAHHGATGIWRLPPEQPPSLSTCTQPTTSPRSARFSALPLIRCTARHGATMMMLPMIVQPLLTPLLLLCTGVPQWWMVC